ncbi:unnamed protein product [Bemisia tabaci]|uniref:Uncharacterized protein n=1 Tax=Bemisia tabaci TaxID=7038 RepID=A0A9P0F9T5_BEMTA|nr:unnamed protein product [Bemisia tabaci]
MISALICFALIFLTSTEASVSPTTTHHHTNHHHHNHPPSKSFDELLDALTAVETNCKIVIKEATEEGTERKSNETFKCLELVRQADEALVNIRHFFDAGRIFFNFSKNIQKDAHKGTDFLREEKFSDFSNQMNNLAATYETLSTQMKKMPKDEFIKLRPVFDILKQSDTILTPLVGQFQINLEESKEMIKKYQG